MTLVKFNPFFQAPVLNPRLHNYFEKSISDFIGSDGSFATPAVNIVESQTSYRLEVAAPGLSRESFNIQVTNNRLTVSAKVETNTEESTEKFTRREFNYKQFERSFSLPKTVDTDKIEATYRDGLLHILLPKREDAKENLTRSISIN